MHASAGIAETAAAIVRAGFEYQGQKCSACSRVYVPSSRWAGLKDTMLAMIESIGIGDVMNFSNFVNAVIDERAYKKIMKYIDIVNTSKEACIIAGGTVINPRGITFCRPSWRPPILNLSPCRRRFSDRW